jgi:hypothetical protein
MTPLRLLFTLFCSLAAAATAGLDRAICESRAYSTWDATKAHDAALATAMQGDYAAALWGFRRACELAPSNARFMSDLGVTLLRLGRLRACEAAFQRSLELDPGMSGDNLREAHVALARVGEAPRRSSRAQALLLPGGGAASADALPSSPDWVSIAMELDPGEVAAAAGAACTGVTVSGRGAVARGGVRRRLAPPLDAQSFAAFTSACGIEHAVRRLPRVNYSDLGKPANAHFAAGLAPYILTRGDALPQRSLSALARAGDPALLVRSRLANLTADFYPAGLPEPGAHPYLMPFSDGIAELMAPSGAFPAGPLGSGGYVHLNFDFYDWRHYLESLAPWTVPDALDTPDAWLLDTLGGPLAGDFQIGTHWRMLLLGTEGAGMFSHQDRLKTASYQLQIAGVKTWALCAPDQTPSLSVHFNHFAPNYGEFPNARSASCYLDAVVPGEIIFYPADYWHQTLNTPSNDDSLSVAITDTLVDATNFDLVAEGLREKCVAPTPNVRHGFTPTVCAALPRLTAWWDAAFRGRNASG